MMPTPFLEMPQRAGTVAGATRPLLFFVPPFLSPRSQDEFRLYFVLVPAATKKFCHVPSALFYPPPLPPRPSLLIVHSIYELIRNHRCLNGCALIFFVHLSPRLPFSFSLSFSHLPTSSELCQACSPLQTPPPPPLPHTKESVTFSNS